MAKSSGSAQRGRPRPARRGPSKPWLARNAIWVSAALALGLVVIAVIARSGPDRARKPTTASVASAGVVGGDFHSLVVDPNTPGRLFVGGHEASSASRDGGRTWTRVAALDNADAMAWGFTSEAIYLSGHPGLKRSDDGGITYRNVDGGLPSTDVHAFGASAKTLYAAGPANGVVASTDGGRTWKRRTQDAGQAFFGRILIGPDDDAHLIAADAQNGPAESTDGGRTWRRLGGLASAVWVSRGGTNLYASGPDGASKTVDGGVSWKPLTLPAGATLVEADPVDVTLLYTGALVDNAVRVWTSHDGGAHWARPRRPPSASTSAAYAAAYAGLCDARAQAASPDAARTIFFDRVHQRIHDLATATGRDNRPGAARLLEAKEAVEADFTNPGPLPDDLDQLLVATRRAIEITGSPSPVACKDKP